MPLPDVQQNDRSEILPQPREETSVIHWVCPVAPRIFFVANKGWNGWDSLLKM